MRIPTSARRTAVRATSAALLTAGLLGAGAASAHAADGQPVTAGSGPIGTIGGIVLGQLANVTGVLDNPGRLLDILPLA